LRATKLDELPQLWNVIRGDMSLVGPRPEVPDYVHHYPHLFELVLQQRPGITDVCTLHLRDEERILGDVDEPERFYVEKLLPRKLAASIREGWRRTFWRDLRVLVATVLPGLTRVPGGSSLAPAPDFRPLADLYAWPTSAARSARAAAAAGGSRESARIEITA
jgi:lipopolysaccharide/colanic/teichoic acid biosynthesis glycosyltransferase